MRELKKIIRRVRYLSESGKVLLAASLLIGFSVATLPTKWIVSNTVEDSDACMPVSRCGIIYHHPMQLDLSSRALHVEVEHPSNGKPAHRPPRFGFSKSDR